MKKLLIIMAAVVAGQALAKGPSRDVYLLSEEEFKEKLGSSKERRNNATISDLQFGCKYLADPLGTTLSLDNTYHQALMGQMQNTRNL